MKQITVSDRQSLFDIALQTSGHVEAAFELARRNAMSVTDGLEGGSELETVRVMEREIVQRYAVRKSRPATDVSAAEMAIVPCGGIHFMGIEIDFKVS